MMVRSDTDGSLCMMMRLTIDNTCMLFIAYFTTIDVNHEFYFFNGSFSLIEPIFSGFFAGSF